MIVQDERGHDEHPSAGIASASVQTPLPPPRHLIVVTDGQCELCRQCRAWLSQQALLIPVEFLDVGSAEALRRYQELGNRRDVLVVADEHGRIWTGPDAFIMCLWATAAYRGWSHWAARPGWRILAKALFSTVSSNRHRIADLMSGECTDERCSAHDGQSNHDGGSSGRVRLGTC